MVGITPLRRSPRTFFLSAPAGLSLLVKEMKIMNQRSVSSESQLQHAQPLKQLKNPAKPMIKKMMVKLLKKK